MLGAGIGTLNVFVNYGTTEKNMVSISGSKGNVWKYYSFTVETASQWTIIFEGILYHVVYLLYIHL